MGEGHEILCVEYKEPVYVRFTYNSSQGIRRNKLDLLDAQVVFAGTKGVM